MGDLRKTGDRFATDFDAGAVCGRVLRMSFLQSNQAGHQSVVFAVQDFWFGVDVVEAVVPLQLLAEFSDLVEFINFIVRK